MNSTTVRRSRRKSSFIVDTPESHNGNDSIVEDSVFDNSQVPDTVERSRRLEVPTKKVNRVRSKNLPSILPGEQTFVTQSQQVALSSTLVDQESTNSDKVAEKTKGRRKSQSRRRSSLSCEGFVKYILTKERTPSPTKTRDSLSPRSRAKLANLSALFPDSSDEEKEPGEVSNDSELGSVQKFLPKPRNDPQPKPRQSRPRSRGKPSKVRVVRKLAEDLRRKSLVNKTIEEDTEDGENDDPKVLANSYANFSSDSAKALIAAMEGAASQKSSGSSISESESCQDQGEKKLVAEVLDNTSLTPVDMEVATPLPAPALAGTVVMVDFRTGADNRSKPLESLASSLGAVVVKSLTSDVTHLVFKDGSLGLYNKAKKKGVRIVAFSWLSTSKRTGQKAPEEDHPSVSKEKYDSPGLFPKFRKTKSMQPKTIEEDFEAAGKSLKRKQRILSRKNQVQGLNRSRSQSESDRGPFKGLTLTMNPDSPLDRLRNLTSGLVLSPRPAETRDVSPSQDLDTPLIERLARRFQSPATQTKPVSGDDIPEVTQEDQTAANPTEAVPEVVPPKRRSTRTSRGTKRKLEDELEQSSSTLGRPTLRDVSNSVQPPQSKSRHKLYSSSASQLLEVSSNSSHQVNVDNVENVHVTSKSSSGLSSVTAGVKNKSKRKVESRKKTAVASRQKKSPSKLHSSRATVTGRRKAKVCGFVAMTQVEKADRELAKQMAESLGVLGYSETVDSDTTHLVCGQSKRTVNLLKALLRGCWILTKDWLLQSLEEGTWLEEAPFELKDFSPAVSSLRQEREAFSGVFKSNLLKDVGRIYISSQCRVARTDLRELVVLAGGRLVNTARVAEVVVGEFCHVGDSTSPHFVTDHWLLDSVQHHSVRPFLDYPLT